MKKAILMLTLLAAITSSATAGDRIVAKVNGKPIMESRLEEIISGLPENFSKVKNNPEFRRQILDAVIGEELLYQEACREDIEKDPVIRRRIEEARRKILINALLRKHVKVAEITDKEAKAFYEKHKDQFTDATGKQITYSALKPFIVQTLQQQAVKTAVNNYIEELKKQNKIEVIMK